MLTTPATVLLAPEVGSGLGLGITMGSLTSLLHPVPVQKQVVVVLSFLQR